MRRRYNGKLIEAGFDRKLGFHLGIGWAFDLHIGGRRRWLNHEAFRDYRIGPFRLVLERKP